MKHTGGRGRILWLGLGAAVTVFAVMAATWVFVPIWYGSPRDVAAFGSMFGVASTLFSGLALAGVIMAIALQSNELALQREELEATREELRGQKDQLALQQETMSRQRFENTFFHHLALVNSIIDAMDFGTTGRGAPATGRDCFVIMADNACSEVLTVLGKAGRTPDIRVCTLEGYEVFYEYSNTRVGHYFRTLYSTVRYVDESDIGDKMVYMRLVRAQMSSGELALLALNCLTPRGARFKPLVEKYALLKHMQRPLRDFNDEQTAALCACYNSSAFGV